ncbi:MAG: dienelactone hydrolase family protein [Terriglobia bacterium]|jgi:carboxymethylenebutenolidase
MRRIAIIIVCGVLLLASTALAAPVKAQDVTFPSGPDTVSGYLAAPDSPGQHPALVVIHEDWGLTDWVKGQARRLAGQGYVALAVDLYRGQVAHDPAFAYELMVSTPPERAFQDMEAAIHFLAARAEVNKEKIGSIGWSMGGKWSLLLAVHDPFLAACVLNYGSMPTNPADIQKIHAPVLGIFGSEDRTIPISDVEAFEDAMKSAHKSIDVEIYPRAGHAFENSENKLGYHEAAAEDAWQRTVAFLDHNLK